MSKQKKAKIVFSSQELGTPKSAVLFELIPIRRVWVEKDEKWYFSVVDVVGILSQSADSRNYWKVLKNRLKKDGSEVVTNCNRLKLLAQDGKMRLTDAADVETLLRIIQSIPSPKAEPFKRWLARVGYERLKETIDPELAVNRARRNWQTLGRSGKWIEQRMRGQEIRNKLTDYWSKSNVQEGAEYAKLTDIIHKEWTDLTTREHKNLKRLKTENLRDNMEEAELLFTALAELSTTNIAKKDQSKGYNENAVSAQKGGGVSKRARNDYELQTGQKVVTGENFLPNTEQVKRIKNNS